MVKPELKSELIAHLGTLIVCSFLFNPVVALAGVTFAFMVMRLLSIVIQGRWFP